MNLLVGFIKCLISYFFCERYIGMENISQFKYELLLLFISVLFAYFSYRKAIIKYKYKTSLILLLITNTCTNIFVILIAELRGIDFIFLFLLVVFLNLVGPYLAIRKVSNYKNQI